MKLFTIKIASAFSLMLFTNFSLLAQTPEKMSYQAVVRNTSNELITNSKIGMKISILKESVNGTPVYTETQTATTNANGLVSIQWGGGTGFNTIDWSNNTYYIKTETDPTGGDNYNITGTTQLLSVPYALHAKTADTMTPGNSIGEMLYWNGNKWSAITPGQEGNILKYINNKPTWVSTTELEYSTVTNPITGKVWMDRNLGASQVATSSTDIASYGDLYQWGRLTDGHEKRTAGTTTTLSNNDIPGHDNFITNTTYPTDWRSPQNSNLWKGVNGINNPCPTGFRIPTVAEWEQELQSWSSPNTVGAFTSPLKLPSGGFRFHDDGKILIVGSNGFYWAQEAFGDQARSFGFDDESAYAGADRRGQGFSIRCIKNE